MLIPAIAVALLVGLILKLGLRFLAASTPYEPRLLGSSSEEGKLFSISWPEYFVGAVIVALVVAPLVVHFGKNVALGDSVGGYKEYWNGYETGTTWDKTECHRDGSCNHEYDCDSYIVWVTDYNSKGEPDGSHPETRWHHCPYTDEEWTFKVQTTLGEYTIASHVLPTDPENHRYRSDKSIPSDLAASSGVPTFWAQAKHRVDSDDPGPVTQVNEYENFILASQDTILQKYSDEIERYEGEGLLPKPASGVTSFYKGDKLYLVGAPPIEDEAAWKSAVNRFDSALGEKLQGDLHLLIVDSAKVPDPDSWFGALQAYWQSPELGKNSLSKNGIVLALGTSDGKTVDWARAGTGMPVGNEQMLAALRNELVGQPLDPATLLGPPRAELVDGEPKIDVGDGKVARIVLAGPDEFHRVCMNCSSDGDESSQSYDYLKSEVPLTGTQKFWIVFFTVLASLFIWGAFVLLDDRFGDSVTSALRSVWGNSKNRRDSDPDLNN